MLCEELSSGQTQRRCKNNPAITSLAMSRCSEQLKPTFLVLAVTKFEYFSLKTTTFHTILTTYSLFPAQESCYSFGRRCLGKSFHLDL